MGEWLLELEKKMDDLALEGSHINFRLFLSADPSNDIPIGILERSIKLTNEPPQGLKPNMKRAFTFFDRDVFNERDAKVKTILFGLCYFHSVLIERRKFGPKGWNRSYPFSLGDLRDSSQVLVNYMDRNQGGKIPWSDLKYIFGEIMYGGHITDDIDRLLCMSYLDFLLKDELLDEAELLPYVEGKGLSFKVPQAMEYEKYIEYIETELPGETPANFGMHPNAEIDFRTNKCIVLFKTMQELQPADDGDDEEGGSSRTQVIEAIIAKISDDVNIENNRPKYEEIAA